MTCLAVHSWARLPTLKRLLFPLIFRYIHLIFFNGWCLLFFHIFLFKISGLCHYLFDIIATAINISIWLRLLLDRGLLCFRVNGKLLKALFEGVETDSRCRSDHRLQIYDIVHLLVRESDLLRGDVVNENSVWYHVEGILKGLRYLIMDMQVN